MPHIRRTPHISGPSRISDAEAREAAAAIHSKLGEAWIFAIALLALLGTSILLDPSLYPFRGKPRISTRLHRRLTGLSACCLAAYQKVVDFLCHGNSETCQHIPCKIRHLPQHQLNSTNLIRHSFKNVFIGCWYPCVPPICFSRTNAPCLLFGSFLAPHMRDN